MASKKPETKLIERIHDLLGHDVYHLKMQLQVAGVADVWYSGSNGDLWVEYKILDAPVKQSPSAETDTIPVTLSPMQSTWLGNRAQEGRHVAVVIGSVDRKYALVLEAGAWLAPVTVSDFLDLCIPVKDVAAWIRQQVGVSHFHVFTVPPHHNSRRA